VAGSPRAKSAPIAAIIPNQPATTPKKSRTAALPASPESSLDIAASAAKHWEAAISFDDPRTRARSPLAMFFSRPGSQGRQAYSAKSAHLFVGIEQIERPDLKGDTKKVHHPKGLLHT
jgi:hypothetical protein